MIHTISNGNHCMSGQSITIGDRLFIGRHVANDIVIDINTISRHHALLMRSGGDTLLIDLDSANGTMVNLIPVVPDEPVTLADGDVINLNDVTIRYLARPGGAQGDQPTIILEMQSAN